MAFQKGHPYRFNGERRVAGPGRGHTKEKLRQRKNLEYFMTMIDSFIETPPTLEDMKEIQKFVTDSAKSDYNFTKIFFDRMDKAFERMEDRAAGSIPVVESLEDVPKVKAQAMRLLGEDKITFTKHKKIMDALKASRDADIEIAIEAGERIKRASEG